MLRRILLLTLCLVLVGHASTAEKAPKVSDDIFIDDMEPEAPVQQKLSRRPSVLAELPLRDVGSGAGESDDEDDDLVVEEEGSGDSDDEDDDEDHDHVGSGSGPRVVEVPPTVPQKRTTTETPPSSRRTSRPKTQPTTPRPTATTTEGYDVNGLPDLEQDNKPTTTTASSGDVFLDRNNNQEVHIYGQKPDNRPVTFFAQPGILAAVIGGAVVGLLCAILLVMFIVYRMRKKDEGSYALDEPKRNPAAMHHYSRPNNKEFYA